MTMDSSRFIRRHKTRDGKVLAIIEMEDSHLLNTIAYIRRRAKKGFSVISGSGDSPDSFDFDEEFMEGKDAEEWLHLKWYLEEAAERNLKC